MHCPNHLEDNKNRVGQKEKKVKQIEGSITKEGFMLFGRFRYKYRLEDFILI